MTEIKRYIKITSNEHLICNTFRIPFGSIEIDFIYKPSELFLGIHFIYKPLEPFKRQLYNLRFFFSSLILLGKGTRGIAFDVL